MLNLRSPPHRKKPRGSVSGHFRPREGWAVLQSRPGEARRRQTTSGRQRSLRRPAGSFLRARLCWGSWGSRVPRPTRLWAVRASPGPAPGSGLAFGQARGAALRAHLSPRRLKGHGRCAQAQFPVSPGLQGSFPQPAAASARLFACDPRLLTPISAFA